jgi:sugar lactone lactonase YvrE
VRRHAKASSAGTTSGQGASLGSFRAFATRGASFDAKGSGALSGHRLVGALSIFALLLAMALSPSAASAAKIHVLAPFSPIDGKGITPNVTLHRPSGIAVDEASGNVFLNDGTGEGNVTDIFGAEGGVPTGVASPYQITGFAFDFEPSGVAVDNSATSPSKGALYIVDVDNHKVKKYVRNGGTEEYEAAGELIPTSGPGFSYPMGAAVDSHGNVFIADWENEAVIEFSPTGAQLARISTSSTVGHPSSAAVDAAGDLFVQGYENERQVYRYPANGAGEVKANEFQFVISGASGLAVDLAANSLYVARGDRVSQYNATSLAPQEEFGSGTLIESERIAVNSATERVYVSDAGANEVAVFDSVPVPGVTTGEPTAVTTAAATLNGTVNPNGVALEECKFEYGTTTSYGQVAACVSPNAAEVGSGTNPVAVDADISSLAIGGAYHFRLVAKNENGTVKGSDVSFRTAGPPEVHAEAATRIHDTTARLEAQVYPGRQSTTYHFEYVSAADFSATGYAKAISVPLGGEAIGSGAKDVEVVQAISGLAPLTTYHFRVIATNPSGTIEGADKTFTTYLAPFAGLPDGRVYEQASPVNKNGTDALGRVVYAKASVNGDAVGFVTTSGVPGAEGSQEIPTYLSSRGASNWSTQGMLPAESAGGDARVLGWTPDFSQIFSETDRLVETGVSGSSFLSRSSAGGALTTIVPETVRPGFAYVGTSADGSQVFFEAGVKLPGTNGIEGKSNVYVWDRDSGKVSLVSVLNDGTAPLTGAGAGIESGATSLFYTQDNHAVAAGGSVYFTANGSGKLYLRKNPTEPQSALSAGKCTEPARACTVEVSASQKKNGKGEHGTDSAGTKPVDFMAATPDGSAAFFTSSEKLTDDANTGPEPPPAAIARADIGGTTGVNLSFLPAAAFGVTVDGSRVYWTNPKAGTIGRANLDGSGTPEPNFVTGAGTPRYIAVDSVYLYWTNTADGVAGHGTIGRAKLDGSAAPEPNFITGADNPQGIVVNATHIFWANSSLTFSGRAIIRANKIDGSGAKPFGKNFKNEPIEWHSGQDGHQNALAGLAIDDTYLYVAANTIIGDNDSGTDTGCITKLDLASEVFAFNMACTGEEDGFRAGKLYGIAVDASHVYWANARKGAIGRQALDGTDKNTSFVPNASQPQGLAIDASHIYWSANQEGVTNLGNDLYRYDADTGDLTDLAPDATDDTNGAEVLGVLGASADGSYVYFAANGDLDGGGVAVPGDCKFTVEGFLGSTGTCSLYLAHAGTVKFIAPLDAEESGGGSTDAFNWLPLGARTGGGEKTSRVTPDGHTVLFLSQEKLTAYDNKGLPQLYRYNVDEDEILCVSCNPTGAAPSGEPSFGSVGIPSIVIPRPPAVVLSRVLSASGNQVFFETTDALVAADTNGDGGCPLVGNVDFRPPACLDVYEWEANGAGSCHTAGGCLYLLSTGKSTSASFIADASASGNDVFFITRSSLVGQDKDQLFDVYDASVGGGLADQNEVPQVPCEGEACKGGATSPPATETPGTPTFSGPGNQKPVHKKARKKRRHHAKKRHHKRHAHAKQARAHR